MVVHRARSRRRPRPRGCQGLAVCGWWLPVSRSAFAEPTASQAVIDCGAQILGYPHATNEKLLLILREWAFLLVTRIL
jgi:hypothetical protein